MSDDQSEDASPAGPSQAAMVAARERIADSVHRTPLLRARSLEEGRAGGTLRFKCENLQRAGAFKARGAMNAVLSLSPEEAAKGVCTHSSGNHGQALALAARERGITAYVVMPRGSPLVKRAAVLGYGAEVIDCEPTLAARESTLSEVANRTGATFIHPYEDPRVIAGQGSVVAEILEDWPQVETIAVPVGGGGLFAGSSLACRYFRSEVDVVGCEPETVNDAAQSLATGRHADAPTGFTRADGLRTRLGTLPFAILRHDRRRVVTVSEQDILAAMRLLWERMKLIVEPSAAVPVAAALRGDFRGRPTAVILSGGNVDLDSLPFEKVA